MNTEKMPDPSYPSHPSVFIPPQAAQAIREVAPEAERIGQLHAQQLSVIYEQRWFNLYVPEEYGGLALSLPEGLRIEEGLAWVDGSVGWTVTLCSGANWFAGFLNAELAKRLFNNPKVCFAGSGRPSGIAKRTDKGFTISGSWDYASGSPHATAFTANCVIEEGGVALRNEDGSPLVRAFLFLREEILLEETWHVMGLIATASNRFSVEELEVPEDRCFLIDADHAALSYPLYKYPFLRFAEATLAVNSSGMAARFLELGESIIAERVGHKNPEAGINEAGIAETGFESDGLSSVRLAREAIEKLQVLRRIFYEAVQSSWEAGLRMGADADWQKGSAGMKLLEEVGSASRRLAAGARQLVDELYPFCGIAAARADTEINRVWRNLHTASQHSLLLH